MYCNLFALIEVEELKFENNTPFKMPTGSSWDHFPNELLTLESLPQDLLLQKLKLEHGGSPTIQSPEFLAKSILRYVTWS